MFCLSFSASVLLREKNFLFTSYLLHVFSSFSASVLLRKEISFSLFCCPFLLLIEEIFFFFPFHCFVIISCLEVYEKGNFHFISHLFRVLLSFPASVLLREQISFSRPIFTVFFWSLSLPGAQDTKWFFSQETPVYKTLQKPLLFTNFLHKFSHPKGAKPPLPRVGRKSHLKHSFRFHPFIFWSIFVAINEKLVFFRWLWIKNFGKIRAERPTWSFTSAEEPRPPFGDTHLHHKA